MRPYPSRRGLRPLLRMRVQHVPCSYRQDRPRHWRLARHRLCHGARAGARRRAGAHVVAVARTVGGLEELDDAIRALGASATLVPLDLKDHAGIARLAGALAERYQRLDILIGNAGVLGPLSPLGHVEPQAWDDVIAINVTANWHLIRATDMLLRLSEAGGAG